MTAVQVADRLGVELATVYAYASRGSLTRHPGPDGRSSRYDPDEVELLAQRSRPRSIRRGIGAVDVVIGTTVSEIGDGWIRYRNHDLAELAGSASFETVASLLWTGELMDPDELSAPQPLVRARVIDAVGRATRALPKNAAISSRLAVGAAAAAPWLPAVADDADPTKVGLLLLDALVESLPLIGSAPAGKTATLAARLWPRISGRAATARRVAALDLALVMLAEHELATSTLAVRVAASTGAAPAASVLAGIGAVSGPLHGQAAVRVHDRLLAGPNVGAEILAEDGPVSGFGHPVHLHGDPRFAVLHEAVLAIAQPAYRARIEDDLIEAKRWDASFPNVDTALGALGFVAAVPSGITEAIFAISRTAGWLAHAFEEADEAPLRFRGRTVYRGAR